MSDSKLNEMTEHGIIQIRQWLEKQPHLNFRIDNEKILTFLRCCKFSSEKTKRKIDTYYTIRTLAPEIFSNRNPLLPELQLLLKTGCMVPLPKVDRDGCRIIYFRFNDNLDPKTMPLDNLAKLTSMMVDVLLLEDDQAIINGVKMFVTLKNVASGYVPQLTPAAIKKYTHYVTKSFPLRILEVYVVKLPSLLQTAHSILKTILSKKLSQRLLIFSDHTDPELFEKLPKNLLPEELGGGNGSLQDLMIQWKQKIESYRKWYLEEEKQKSDESLRLGRPTTSSSLFGIRGLFRQLHTD